MVKELENILNICRRKEQMWKGEEKIQLTVPKDLKKNLKSDEFKKKREALGEVRN
jgi:hypothetical protein